MGATNPEQEQFGELRRRVADQLGVKPQVYVISQRSLAVALSRYAPGGQDIAPAKDEMLVSQKRLVGFEAKTTLEEILRRVIEYFEE